MSSYEIQYADQFGQHAEALDAWDDQDAAQNFRMNHRGERVQLVDVIRLGDADELETAA